MPLIVTRRSNRNDVLTIDGIIRLPDGTRKRIQRRAASNDWKLAQEEAALIEAEALRTAWHGPRKGSRSFSEAILSYCDAGERSRATKNRLQRVLGALGDVPLGSIDQDVVAQLCDRLLRPGAKPATIEREVRTPIRSVLRHAATRRWCDPPLIPIHKTAEGRVRCVTPAEAQRLIDTAADHLKPLLTFLFCTGCRLSEALQIDRADIRGSTAILWADATKSGKRRNVDLVPRAVATLDALPHRKGRVFRKPDGIGYPVTRERNYGGQIKTAWHTAVKRAGLDPELTPHDTRHTWASWHYALYKDPIRLKLEGGWSSLNMVEKYAHLIDPEHRDAIEAFLLCDQSRDQPKRRATNEAKKKRRSQRLRRVAQW